MEIHNEDAGLRTRDALNKLYIEIEAVLQQYKISQKSRYKKISRIILLLTCSLLSFMQDFHWLFIYSRRAKSWYKDALSLTSQRTTINCLSIIFGIWTAISLIIGYILEGDNLAGYEAIPISVLLLISVSLEMYDNKLRHDEVPNRVRAVLQRLANDINNIHWVKENYPDLYAPLSPCITLQWTYRDETLVNLPWALLVKDDVILMRPGKSFIINIISITQMIWNSLTIPHTLNPLCVSHVNINLVY